MKILQGGVLIVVLHQQEEVLLVLLYHKGGVLIELISVRRSGSCIRISEGRSPYFISITARMSKSFGAVVVLVK